MAHTIWEAEIFCNSRKNIHTRINFILDEFSSLPVITDFPQMISASRSRNIRFVLVVQSKHQLRQRYEDETDTIMSNCMNWMFLTSRETELLREISELSGRTGNNNEMLVSVSQLQHLDKEKGECLVFCGRKNPYISKLPDIETYDNNVYQVEQMQLREQIDFPSDYGKSTFFRDVVLYDSVDEEFIIKFDELFGTVDD